MYGPVQSPSTPAPSVTTDLKKRKREDEPQTVSKRPETRSLHLPDETWISVLQHADLHPYEVVRLQQVNKQFSRVARDNAIWKGLVAPRQISNNTSSALFDGISSMSEGERKALAKFWHRFSSFVVTREAVAATSHLVLTPEDNTYSLITRENVSGSWARAVYINLHKGIQAIQKDEDNKKSRWAVAVYCALQVGLSIPSYEDVVLFARGIQPRP